MTFTGVIVPSLEWPQATHLRLLPGTGQAPVTSTDSSGNPVTVTTVDSDGDTVDVVLHLTSDDALEAISTAAGPLTSHQPIAIRSLALTGTMLTSFTEDWYNRLHLDPTLIDYGAVGATTPRPATLWNAYLGNTTLSDIDIANPDGIQLSGTALPYTLRPLEYVTHQIIATEDGPSTISSTATYITSRESPSVTLTGQRANLWPFFPNWRESVTVESSFKTDIITTRSGREQRRALRSVPRKTVSYTLTAPFNRLRAFNRAMAKWQNRPVVMGDPTRKARVSMAPGVYKTTVYPTPDWIAAGVSLVLDDSELLTVDTVSPLGEIVFRLPTTSGGRFLRPCLTGQLGQSLSAKQPSSGVSEISVTFDVTPGSEVEDTGAPGLYLLNGREVLARRFNWGDGLDVTYGWTVDTLDFTYGRTAITRPIDFGSVTRKANFVQQGAQDMRDLTQFFQRQKGMRGEFYMPSGSNDLPLKSTAVAGSVDLVTGGREVYDAYNGDDVYKAVAIHFRDGRIVTRGLTGMYLSGGDTVLQCDAAFLTDIVPAAVSRVSWLNCSRLASDQFTQEWISDGVAQTSLAVMTLEDLTVENPVTAYDGAAQWVLEVWGERGIAALDSLDYLVNTAYPAVWFIPEAWVTWRSTQQGLSGLDYVVNFRFPEVFPAGA